VRLVGRGDQQDWSGRGHFFAAAAEAMRRILVEHARGVARRRSTAAAGPGRNSAPILRSGRAHEGDQPPSVSRLSVVVKGKGTVWVDEVELLKRPPVSRERAKDETPRTFGDGSKEIGPPPRLIGDAPTKK